MNETPTLNPSGHLKSASSGSTLTTKDIILETGASIVQNFAPVQAICAHLNAFHVYASDTTRVVEANHYCTHLNADIRQCLIYDAPSKGARLIGVEYLISRELYDGLPQEERKLWHSHDYEVGSIRSNICEEESWADDQVVPNVVWEAAETAEMREIVGLYGKTFHFWQVDRGDELPLGMPQLMMSFTEDDQVTWDKIKDRDSRFGVDMSKKRQARKDIVEMTPHQDADSCWK
ncbi:hypothetical protein VE02_10207 [Pseudogymnoascus sp. 03VT05]|nr:hypothetical protein VE02_10207 [Pseudogymnoascus sp. 03VT05]